MSTIVLIIALILLLEIACAFRPIVNNNNNNIRKVNGARSMTAVFDAIAGIALAAKLQTSSINPSILQSSSMPIAKVETKQGMYKEYTVDIKDDTALDKVQKNYKTAEETDENKNKVKIYLFLYIYIYIIIYILIFNYFTYIIF